MRVRARAHGLAGRRARERPVAARAPLRRARRRAGRVGGACVRERCERDRRRGSSPWPALRRARACVCAGVRVDTARGRVGVRRAAVGRVRAGRMTGRAGRAARPKRGPRVAYPGGGRGRVEQGQKGPGQARGRGGRKGREGGERRGKRRKRKWEKEREKKEKGGERNKERKREGGERVGADRGRGRPRVVSAACDA